MMMQGIASGNTPLKIATSGVAKMGIGLATPYIGGSTQSMMANINQMQQAETKSVMSSRIGMQTPFISNVGSEMSAITSSQNQAWSQVSAGFASGANVYRISDTMNAIQSQQDVAWDQVRASFAGMWQYKG